jgi:hypothetical protein
MGWQWGNLAGGFLALWYIGYPAGMYRGSHCFWRGYSGGYLWGYAGWMGYRLYSGYRGWLVAGRGMGWRGGWDGGWVAGRGGGVLCRLK